MDHQLHINSVLADLELSNSSADLSDMVFTVYHIFEKDKNTPGLILLKDGHFYGLLSRTKFFETMSKQFMYDLYSKRRIDSFFNDEPSGKYLILSSSTTIIVATNQALNRDGSAIFEPIIVNCGKSDYRLLDFYHLILAQNTIQTLMNELLIQANEFKKEVLAIATHDLRNPIGTIMGFSDLMADSEDISKCKEYAVFIHKTASQMEDLVNSFLVSAINDSIKHKLDFSNFDINELVLSVIKSFELAAVKKNQKMIYEILSFPVNITSDRLKIKEVIENLISNAIKYSEENKRISVVVKKNEDFIEIMVTDQGPGFSESDLKKIFGKFQRLSARPTGDESSSGLGLFITKTIVDNLKGSIDLESEPGKGSTFRVKLPFSNRPVFEVKKADRQQLNREVHII